MERPPRRGSGSICLSRSLFWASSFHPGLPDHGLEHLSDMQIPGLQHKGSDPVGTECAQESAFLTGTPGFCERGPKHQPWVVHCAS